MEATELDGSDGGAGVEQQRPPSVVITPATVESTPAPPETIDESLLVPPPRSTRARRGSLSEAGESSSATVNTPSDEADTASTNEPESRDPSLPSKAPRARNDRKSPFTAKFFGDMLNTIDRTFPYQTFANEHDCTVGDVHRALLATVFAPLTDANEKGKPRVAEKGRSMMKEWNQRYKEMVRKLNKESNERQMPMEFEQVLVAASQNLDAYWESRNSGFEAYKAFQNTKKKQVLEDRADMLKRAAERDAELTQEAAEARRKRPKFEFTMNDDASPSMSATTTEGEPSSSSSSAINNNTQHEHVDLTEPTTSPSSQPKPNPPTTKRHPVLVDSFGNYQDMPEAASDFFDEQYRDMAAGTYVGGNSFEDMDDDDDDDGDYEDEKKNGGIGKGKGKRDVIGDMLAVIRRNPSRQKKGKGKGKEADNGYDVGEEDDYGSLGGLN